VRRPAFAALFVAHQVADHWIQTQHQADTKGCPGWPGRIACAAHVASYTATHRLPRARQSFHYLFLFVAALIIA
jgi:hypothetical protein